MNGRHTVLKDLGAPLAVLAIYLLTLLTPLHHAAWLQKDFAKLGYEASSAWSVCTAINDADANQETPDAVHCPVAAIGKAQVFADVGGSALLAPIAVAGILVPADSDRHEPPLPARTRPHPRAPPVLI
ncbi:hypothetical protein [Devosia pacifica]|nr:hypothetical protein [Devosia pacifica]